MAALRNRNGTWRAQVRIKGHAPRTRYFTFIREAERWAGQIESQPEVSALRLCGGDLFVFRPSRVTHAPLALPRNPALSCELVGTTPRVLEGCLPTGRLSIGNSRFIYITYSFVSLKMPLYLPRTMQEFNPDFISGISLPAPGRHIHDVRAPDSGSRVGVRIGGGFSGPNALVVGNADLMRPVLQSLLMIPSLAWMRGNLFAIAIEGLEGLPSGHGLSEILSADGPIDGQITLPSLAMKSLGHKARSEMIKRSHRSVLRLCTQLGMIRGRGVLPVREHDRRADLV